MQKIPSSLGFEACLWCTCNRKCPSNVEFWLFLHCWYKPRHSCTVPGTSSESELQLTQRAHQASQQARCVPTPWCSTSGELNAFWLISSSYNGFIRLWHITSKGTSAYLWSNPEEKQENVKTLNKCLFLSWMVVPLIHEKHTVVVKGVGNFLLLSWLVCMQVFILLAFLLNSTYIFHIFFVCIHTVFHKYRRKVFWEMN